MKRNTIKISGNEITSIDDSDVFLWYNDLWKTAAERNNGHNQGIIMSAYGNTTVGAGNEDSSYAADKAIADAFDNRFYIPLKLRSAREPHVILPE